MKWSSRLSEDRRECKWNPMLSPNWIEVWREVKFNEKRVKTWIKVKLLVQLRLKEKWRSMWRKRLIRSEAWLIVKFYRKPSSKWSEFRGKMKFAVKWCWMRGDVKVRISVKFIAKWQSKTSASVGGDHSVAIQNKYRQNDRWLRHSGVTSVKDHYLH